jgi:hypothetical protein
MFHRSLFAFLFFAKIMLAGSSAKQTDLFFMPRWRLSSLLMQK